MGGPEADASSPGPPLQTQALSKKIDELKAKQAAMLAERKRVTKDLRNCEKRRKRLKANARRLSDEDLAEVMRMREHTKKWMKSRIINLEVVRQARRRKKKRPKVMKRQHEGFLLFGIPVSLCFQHSGFSCPFSCLKTFPFPLLLCRPFTWP